MEKPGPRKPEKRSAAFEIDDAIFIPSHHKDGSTDPKTPKCESTEGTITTVNPSGLSGQAKCNKCSFTTRVS